MLYKTSEIEIELTNFHFIFAPWKYTTKPIILKALSALGANENEYGILIRCTGHSHGLCIRHLNTSTPTLKSKFIKKNFFSNLII